MAKKSDGSIKPTEGLRKQAEALLCATRRDVAAMPIKDVQQLVYELQVHQIELDMQNVELRRTQVELEAACDRYMDLYDFSPTGHFTLDLSGTIVEANLRVGTLLGINRKELIGQALARFIAPDDQDIFHRHCREVLKTGTRQTCEVHLRNETGASSYIYFESLAVHEEPGHVTHWRTALLDITERKQAEEALRAREHEFRLLADNVPALYAYVDRELRYRFVNKRYEEFWGRPASDIVGRLVKDVVGALNFDKLEPHLREAVAGRAVSYTYPMVLPNGDARWIREQYMPDSDGTGLNRGVLSLASDVTAQIHAEQTLQQSQAALQEKREELQTLADKLMTAQDEERKRIARDLHDDFNQRLAALSVELESIEQAPIASHKSIIRQLEAIRGHIGQLSEDLHDLAYRLHPSLLEHVGLEMAIRDHVAELSKRTGLPVTYDACKVPRTLPQEIATNLFRVLQESLQNVSKHAQATNVTVRLTGSPKGIGLSVRDNGKGFDLEGLNIRRRGLGLMSMQERTRGLGGFLRIHSSPKDGTKVCAWIPHASDGA